MIKRGNTVLSVILLAIILSSFAYAQDSDIDQDSSADASVENSVSEEVAIEEDSTDILDEASEEYSDETLDIDAGTTPGEFGYFVDDFFDQFGNEADVMAEKFKEMKQLLAEGKKDEAKIALENFREYAKKLQENADPEDRDKIRKYMAAINHELVSLRGQGNDELIIEVEDSARNTLSAVELSRIIKDACSKLIELSASDPTAEGQFNKLCKPSEDSSEWHKEYYEDLTKEQQEEVKKFVKEIKQCFRNPADCNCAAATDNQAFVNSCELITKAEVDCRAGDESACQLSQDLGEEIFQSLEDKPYLRDALKDIEREFSDMDDDRFDNHLPEECEEAGATDRESCMKVMFKLNAPEECVAAVENGDIDLSNEREARKQCEEIMFTSNAPEECISEGIRDHKECGKFMFKENAPQECIDAGLTGESQRDHKKCEEIMNSIRGEEGPGGQGQGINFDCRKIQDSDERLDCFDKVASGAQEHFDNRGEGSWPPECEEAGATDKDSCGEIMRKKFGERREAQGEFDNREPNNNFRQGSPPCNSPEECEKFRQQNPDFRDEFSQTSPPGEFREGATADSPEPSQSESSASGSSGSDGSSSSGSSSGGITGNIINNNRFIQYYFRF